MLHSVGACSSYREATNYLNCAVNSPQPTVQPDAFVQFVFDNADVNTRTLNGFGTFHALGGIKCITPAKSVLKCPPAARIIGANCNNTSNQIPISPYKRPPTSGLKNVIMKDLTSDDGETVHKGFKLEVLWLAY